MASPHERQIIHTDPFPAAASCIESPFPVCNRKCNCKQRGKRNKQTRSSRRVWRQPIVYPRLWCETTAVIIPTATVAAAHHLLSSPVIHELMNYPGLCDCRPREPSCAAKLSNAQVLLYCRYKYRWLASGSHRPSTKGVCNWPLAKCPWKRHGLAWLGFVRWW